MVSPPGAPLMDEKGARFLSTPCPGAQHGLKRFWEKLHGWHPAGLTLLLLVANLANTK